MREVPLSTLEGGIDRLRIRGGAKAGTLYDFVNAFRTAVGTPRPRPGTSRVKNLPAGTIGLTAFDGCLHVFASAYVNVDGLIRVSIGDSGSGGYGWSSSPSYGSVSPAAPELEGIGIGGIVWIPGSNLFRLFMDEPLLPALTEDVVVETGTEGEYVTLAAGGVTIGEGTYSWTTTEIGWDLAVGEVRTIGVPPVPCIELNILLHPTDPTASLSKIHFAAPFQGALYVVAEFDDGGIYHYWLQQADAWEADTEYSANQFVSPTTDNGYVYRATRFGNAYPAWAPGVPRTAGNGSSIEPDRIEPTVYNEFYYEVVDTDGDNPRSGSIEPDWPTSSGERIIENTDGTPDVSPNEVTPPAPPLPNQPQPSSKYSLR